jgi:hypothetical protein
MEVQAWGRARVRPQQSLARHTHARARMHTYIHTCRLEHSILASGAQERGGRALKQARGTHTTVFGTTHTHSRINTHNLA